MAVDDENPLQPRYPSEPWPAPAKINLFLHVVGRRPDGYHLLQTAFQFLDLADWLHVEPREDGALHLHHRIEGLDPDDDLVGRAARTLQRESGCALGADIRLVKRIPVGGGLGGGSSDAATTLVALNALWGLGWPTTRLAQLGLGLGADVPVFVHGQAAWAEGIGEHLRPIAPTPTWYLLVVPGIQVSTAAVFRDPELTRDSHRIKMRDLVSGLLRNDCQDVVCRLYPEVGAALAWLGEFGRARLTGTGSGCFAAFTSATAAWAVHARVPDGWLGYVVRGVNRSALLDRVA